MRLSLLLVLGLITPVFGQTSDEAESLQRLKVQLQSPDRAVREQAVNEARQVRWKDETTQARELLLAAYERESNLKLKGEMGKELIRTSLYEQPAWEGREQFCLEMLNAKEQSLQLDGIEACMNLLYRDKSKTLSDVLLKMAQQKDNPLRESVVTAMVNFAGNHRKVDQYLHSLIGNESEPLAVQKISLAGVRRYQFPTKPETLQDLKTVMQHPNPQMRAEAVRHLNSLFRTQKDALEPVLTALRDEDGMVRAEAAQMLYPMWYMDKRKSGKHFITGEGAGQIGNLLIQMKDDPVYEVRRSALSSLSSINPEQEGFLVALIEQLDVRDEKLISSVVFRIGRLKEKAAPALPKLEAMRRRFGNQNYKKLKDPLAPTLEQAILAIAGEDHLKKLLEDINKPR